MGKRDMTLDEEHERAFQIQSERLEEDSQTLEQIVDDIPQVPAGAPLEVHVTAEAAWQEIAKAIPDDIGRQPREDMKLMFYEGARYVYNLVAFCMGAAGSIEGAMNQVEKDFVAYETEAARVYRERSGKTEEQAGTQH
jgi:hypothetical protein